MPGASMKPIPAFRQRSTPGLPNDLTPSATVEHVRRTIAKSLPSLFPVLATSAFPQSARNHIVATVEIAERPALSPLGSGKSRRLA